MSDTEARFLILTRDGILHAYVRPDILRMDLAGRQDEAVTIYRRFTGLGTVHFAPLSTTEREAFSRGENV